MIELPAFLTGRATCAQPAHDPDLWYSDRPTDQDAAARLCAGCPLRAACSDHALTTREEHGVWGGLTPADRHRRLHPDDETWLDEQGRVRVACGTYAALAAHIRYGETCQPCRDAQAARTRAARAAQLAAEHAGGGSTAGAAIHRRLGEPVCARCRAAVARVSAAQRAARRAGEQPVLAMAS
ncbi:WhiB family transcriptional regulator [Streptomyces sp. NPDC059913]|uniref:WhiB family transcriptional regulator n=1 Tax=unclassified Streptomyces TaxID=2593676 RepID=UPI003659541D